MPETERAFRLAPMTRTTVRQSLIWVLIIGALLVYSLAFQGVRRLWDPDEGRYAAVALTMLESGDWLVPRLPPHVPHFTKPPLTYWLVAASLASVGHSEQTIDSSSPPRSQARPHMTAQRTESRLASRHH